MSTETKVVEIQKDQGFEQKLKEHRLVAVDFTATWCGPCKLIGPVFKALSGTYKDVLFVKVDVDDNPGTAAKYGVRAMPTFKLFDNGEVVGEVVGANKKALEDKIKELNARASAKSEEAADKSEEAADKPEEEADKPAA
ncbi:glycerol ether metabolic process [Coemansia sp. RSA 552]|nr:glycerol ether metabolic process [Coemansia sp. RSA 552]